MSQSSICSSKLSKRLSAVLIHFSGIFKVNGRATVKCGAWDFFFGLKGLKTIGPGVACVACAWQRDSFTVDCFSLVLAPKSDYYTFWIHGSKLSNRRAPTDKFDSMVKISAELFTLTGRYFDITIKFNASTGKVFFDFHVGVSKSL